MSLAPPGRAALVLLLLPWCWLLVPGPPPPRLGPPAERSCAVPVEVNGALRCQGSGAGLGAGDVAPPPGTAGPPGRMAPHRLLAAGVLIDLNRAPAAELEALPGIGPALARRLQAARPLRSPEDLAVVLGPRRAASLLPLVSFGPQHVAAHSTVSRLGWRRRSRFGRRREGGVC